MLDIVRLAGKKIDLCILRTDEEAIEKYTKWLNDASINKWFGYNDTIIQYNHEVDRVTKEASDDKTCDFIIVDKKTRELIGTCAVGCKDGVTAYISIVIGEEKYRNKGYGTEVVSMLVKFAFEEQNAHRVALGLVASNERAYKCYSKVGFVECGRDHEAIFIHGKYEDNIIMEILKKDWSDKDVT